MILLFSTYHDFKQNYQFSTRMYIEDILMENKSPMDSYYCRPYMVGKHKLQHKKAYQRLEINRSLCEFKVRVRDLAHIYTLCPPLYFVSKNQV